MQNNLQVIVKEIGLTPEESKPLLDSFGDAFMKAHKLAVRAEGIKVTAASQTGLMQDARDLRLQLKNLRVESNKTRSKLKEGYLRGGNAVQKIYNTIRDVIVPMEDHLLEQEKFAERIKVAQDNELESRRIIKLSQYVDVVDVYKIHPSDLSTESFNKLLETSKIAHDAKVAAAKKIEDDRLEAQKLERQRLAQIEKDNARLKKEQEEAENKAAIEKEKQEAILAAEKEKTRIAQEKLQAEIDEKEREAKIEVAKIAARDKAEADRILAEKKAQEAADLKALSAPDKEKLWELQRVLSEIQFPAMKTDESQKVLNMVKFCVQKAMNEIRKYDESK